ncbi:integrase [Halobacteriales archaeon QS_6_71_20]|nr:MAG: integrase [Halobacteriales archaeon QS_6_71_20]
MSRDYESDLRRKRENLSEAADEGEVSKEDANRIRELTFAFDEGRPTVTPPSWPDAPSHLEKPRSASTLSNWCGHLTRYARHTELSSADAFDINHISEQMLHGELEGVKDRGLTKGSVRAYQNTVRIFYRYHGDLPAEHGEIVVFEQEDPKVNPDDMLTSEEIERLRAAPEHPRDQAIIDILLYTGMRNTALRTLRVGDVDPHRDDGGVFRFNTDAEGLKDIAKPNAERPLLGAAGAVRDWLNYHPASDDDDAYLIMGKPKYGNPDPHEPVAHRTIERVTKSAKESADIDKPLHPHALRHNFVTLAKKEYGLDDQNVKFLIGHESDSTVMESTYSHLSAEDFRKNAQEAAGLRMPEEESSLTPDYCPRCDEPLPTDNAKACPRCGAALTPDAASAQDRIQSNVTEAALQASGDEERDAIRRIKERLDSDPEAREAVIDALLNDE